MEHLEVFGARGASFHIKIGIKPQSMEICSGQEIEKMNWALRVKGPQQPLAILCENRALSIDMIDVMVKYGSVFDVDAVEALCANPKVTRDLLEAAKRHGALFGFEAAETLCANPSVRCWLAPRTFGSIFSQEKLLNKPKKGYFIGEYTAQLIGFRSRHSSLHIVGCLHVQPLTSLSILSE